MKKEYLAMVDMDGTLFDTYEVNYCAYQKALEEISIILDKGFYKKKCFGYHYKDFLGELLNYDLDKIEEVHKRKKELYSKYLFKARKNEILIMLLESIKEKCNIVLVTTASKNNVMQILSYFCMENFFDKIISQEDVKCVKPNSECYRVAMELYKVDRENCIIFEDSQMGLLAAKEVCNTIMKVESF